MFNYCLAWEKVDLVKLFLTIGVSKAQPLSFLPGAITAAMEMKKWADQADFNTKIITDDGGQPVTVSRIRTELLDLLPQNEVVEAFILHFAGHGYRAGAEQNMWLPTDWNTELRAISVEGLKKRLYGHGIKNLTIVSDACRSLPADVDMAELSLDAVLPRGPYEQTTPIIDRFNAVADGGHAYMLNGDEQSPARCIFSTVMLEGLSGHRSDSFDKYLKDCVTPESLDLFSKTRMKEISECYRLKCSPENTVGTPRDHIIYSRRNEPGNGDFDAPQWPVPPQMPSGSTPDSQITQSWITPPLNVVEKAAVSARIDALHLGIRRNFIFEQRRFHSHTNLVVLGRPPVRIWTSMAESLGTRSRGSHEWYVEFPFQDSAQILIEFDDGIFASAVVYKDLITILSCDKYGVIGWACADRWAEAQRQISSSVEAITNLQMGTFTADQVDSIAAQLREMKHLNPILGAISSYLYDYSGDIDSIRRMAYFYCHYNQSIPFDIAYMGLLRVHWNGRGYSAEVPSVTARDVSLVSGELPHWVTRATDQISGSVAGLWPSLRQGWEFVEEPELEEVAFAESIRDAIPFLLPSQFTSFRREGAEILIQKFNMRPNF
ncbi:caspase family protein [Acetobacter persici]|uniref:caspase family protein n=1 Tax=Acetobacter persici TaxID=1076596 RepID=UPI001BA69D4B|nr:caspase family protein [Acetobacter persici]MBS1001634.1 caspase family protein [Acetobacter persici]